MSETLVQNAEPTFDDSIMKWGALFLIAILMLSTVPVQENAELKPDQPDYETSGRQITNNPPVIDSLTLNNIGDVVVDDVVSITVEARIRR